MHHHPSPVGLTGASPPRQLDNHSDIVGASSQIDITGAKGTDHKAFASPAHYSLPAMEMHHIDTNARSPGFQGHLAGPGTAPGGSAHHTWTYSDADLLPGKDRALVLDATTTPRREPVSQETRPTHHHPQNPTRAAERARVVTGAPCEAVWGPDGTHGRRHNDAELPESSAGDTLPAHAAQHT